MKIFIIIPCFNEAANIGQVIKDVQKYGTAVVVDDGSTDDSFFIAKKNGAITLRHVLNRGQGAALATGNLYALSQQADIVVHFDSDGQHSAEEIPAIIEPIIKGRTDVVFGSRFLSKKTQIPLLKKWLLLKPAIFFQNLFLGVRLTDAHNGFRAFSRKALLKINPQQDGMAHASEYVEMAKINQLEYQEVPVTISYKEFGQGFFSGLKIIRDILFGKLSK